tara:strand:+ start:953 stop:1069 length:117 start_codon:yes stop_codon:yes gene_type:complete
MKKVKKIKKLGNDIFIQTIKELNKSIKYEPKKTQVLGL